ncbi:unnamed protein product [Gordionus sp. m RMFG-2023]
MDDMHKPKWGIYYESGQIKDECTQLLNHPCPECSSNIKTKCFPSLKILKDHLKALHDRYYCDICLKHLKLFTQERKVYTLPELTRHLNEGDTSMGDTSQKGHPSCRFCANLESVTGQKSNTSDFVEGRYLDEEELFKHLRRDHFFCHFCDADGINAYFDTYPVLRDHFRSEHHLCEEGDCKYERFVTAFRNEIDMRAHRIEKHSKTMDKNSQRLLRNVEISFTNELNPIIENLNRNPARYTNSSDFNQNYSGSSNPFPDRRFDNDNNANRHGDNRARRQQPYLDSGTLIPDHFGVDSNIYFNPEDHLHSNNRNIFDDYNANNFHQLTSSDFPSLSIGNNQMTTLSSNSNNSIDNKYHSEYDKISKNKEDANTLTSQNLAPFLPRPFSRTVQASPNPWPHTRLGSNVDEAFPALTSSNKPQKKVTLSSSTFNSKSNQSHSLSPKIASNSKSSNKFNLLQSTTIDHFKKGAKTSPSSNAHSSKKTKKSSSSVPKVPILQMSDDNEFYNHLDDSEENEFCRLPRIQPDNLIASSEFPSLNPSRKNNYNSYSAQHSKYDNLSSYNQLFLSSSKSSKAPLRILPPPPIPPPPPLILNEFPSLPTGKLKNLNSNKIKDMDEKSVKLAQLAARLNGIDL